MKTGFVVLLAALAARAALAGIDWKTTQQKVDAHPLATKASYRFGFAIGGSGPVEFTEVRPSCGCLSVHMQKRLFQPGESGELQVEFDLSDRTGPQRKQIAVETSGAPGKTTMLEVEANIPDGYLLSPALLKWSKTDPLEPMICRLENRFKEPIILEGAISSDPRMKVELVAVREGFEYEARLVPADGQRGFRAVVRIRPRLPDGMQEAKSYRLYAAVE